MGRSRQESGADRHREVSCPGCGATIEFHRPGTLTLVCEFCQTAVRRTDFEAQNLGKLSERVLLASWFQIGTRGSYRGSAFEVRGQLQLDHGRGLWNEWAVEFADETWAWIAEAQGSLYLLWDEEVEGELPPAAETSVGDSVAGLPDGEWLVSEVGEGRVVTAAGELPVALRAGETTRYADVCRGERGFGSLDWTRVGDAPEVLLGEQITVEMLELDPDTMPEHQPDRVSSQRVACPHCGEGIDLHDPELTRRVVCGACSHVLSNERGRVQDLQQEVRAKGTPALELGGEGSLDGRHYRVLGVLTRQVSYQGQTWRWHEYLLRERGRGYAFLVDNQGHWALLHPISPAASSGQRQRRYQGRSYRHFTSGRPKVVFVLGEFFWDVAVGDESQTHDFVSPPRMLSVESTETESVASEGAHVEPDQVLAAFGRPGREQSAWRRTGVGMVQPNPHRPLRRLWGLAGLALGSLLLMMIVFAIASDSEVLLDETYGPVPAAESEDAVVISEPFEITDGGDNMRIRLEVPGLNNGWVGVAGTLVETKSGEVRSFVVDAGLWSGVSDGESWTEGSRTDSTFLGSIEPGTYQMRFASLGSQSGVGRNYKVEVRRDVLRMSWFVLAFLVLLIWPVITSVRAFFFEKKRWDESDHPWGESS